MSFLASLLFAAFGVVAASVTPSPYAGMERQDIKALSAEQIQAYLAGEGMGLAMPAELNSYPGPKHVLQIAGELELRPDQRAAVQVAFDEMHRAAVQLGRELVEQEARLDSLFAGGTAEPGCVRDAVEASAAIRGRLRFAHLRAHLETRAILTAEQRAAYDRLRGYDAGEHEGHHPAGHPGRDGGRLEPR